MKKWRFWTLLCFLEKGKWSVLSAREPQRDMPSFTSPPMWIRPISLTLLFFISLIGNLSTLGEIKAENQCLVSNNFQTNLFHLFSPPPYSPPPSSFSRSFSLQPPNANRGSRVMTSLSLLSCSNNALKIERERGMWQRERERDAERKKKKKQEMDWLKKKIHSMSPDLDLCFDVHVFVQIRQICPLL